MTERVGWRLCYRDGVTVAESADVPSVRLAPRGALALEAVTEHGAVLFRVQLTVDGELWQPIWYRKRRIVLDGSGEIPTTIVCGRAHVAADDTVTHALIAILEDGRVAAAPAWAIDHGAIAAQARAA